jgi:hypothetical protein
MSCIFCRSAARAVVMKERVAAIEERERQRRYRMASLGQEAVQAGGADMGRFIAQLGTKGTSTGDAAAGAQQQQPPEPSKQ